MTFNIQTPNKKTKPSWQDSFESYVAYLEQQVLMRDQAIKKAECLINLYRKENVAIKEQNRQLKEVICHYEDMKAEREAELMHYQCKKQIKSLLQEKVELLQVVKLHQSQIRYLINNRKDREQKDQRSKKNKFRLKTSHTYETIQDQPERSFKQFDKEQSTKNSMKKRLEQKLQKRDKEVVQLLKKVHDLQLQCDLAQSYRDQSINPQFLPRTPEKPTGSASRKPSTSQY